MEIDFGTVLRVTTATGAEVEMRAIRRPERGIDFPVVWVATEAEFQRAAEVGDEPDALPWPMDAVSVQRKGLTGGLRR